jgi:hypothetical protein
MTAMIQCACGYKTERTVETTKMAEVIADRHESGDVRRPYRHETAIAYDREGR